MTHEDKTTHEHDFNKLSERFAKMEKTDPEYGAVELELSKLLQAPFVEGNAHDEETAKLHATAPAGMFAAAHAAKQPVKKERAKE